ncbi:5-formyltetrahydrofolate cyclo-ligase [Ferrovibrio sp.]|uniref:5-formyltetrahydrofolate cyclo-ligase n=1 Tax=Ferrovibrio sp. TaxID=1917215 RepID=UPI0035B41F18
MQAAIPDPVAVEAVHAEKARLRARLRARRAEAAAANGAAIAQVAAERFLAAIPLKPDLVKPDLAIAGYWPMADELDPRPLLARLRTEHGARILLPVTPAQKGGALDFREWTESATLLPGRYGIPAPGPQAAALRPDIMLVPLVGFDVKGERLGMGAGYYDATLAALRSDGGQAPLAVGYAFAVQQAPAIPARPEDQRLDWVVTERGAIWCAGNVG